jgi:hypothetical protein
MRSDEKEKVILPHHVWLWIDHTKSQQISLLATNSKLKTITQACTWKQHIGTRDPDSHFVQWLAHTFPLKTTTFHLAGIGSTHLYPWILQNWPRLGKLLHHVCIDFEPFVYLHSLMQEQPPQQEQPLAALLLHDKKKNNKIDRDVCVGRWARARFLESFSNRCHSNSNPVPF